MESTKTGVVLFLLFFFCTPVFSQEWVQLNCIFNSESGDLLSDYREGTALVVSARLKQS